MAEHDVFGQVVPAEDDPEPEPGPAAPPAPEAPPAEPPPTAPEEGDEPLQGDGEVPQDPAAAHKYWQGAYTRSRQKDREKYGKLESEHGQYQQLLTRFYQDEAYAKQVLAQRFPQLAAQIVGQPGPAPHGTPASPASGVTHQLQQSLGDYGFLAPALGPVLERVIAEQVQQRLSPFEQRTQQQAEQARQAEETRLLAAMDAAHPGWESSYGTQMQELNAFLASDALTHPKFGDKYTLFYRLLNPDAARIAATREMANAARQRTGFGRSGRSSVPNVQEQVRTADTARDAFKLAAEAAMQTQR
jgi:hypothetical protein